MNNPDLEEFKKDASWFIKQYDKVEFVSEDLGLNLSSDFKINFPQLFELLGKARVLRIKINGQPYHLLSWTNKNKRSCGWLIEIEETTGELDLIEEHKLLLKEMGGIREVYNDPEPSLSNNQNFMFLESESSLGIGGWDDYYEMLCEDYEKKMIAYEGFICFVQEANGDVSLYNPKNGEVMLFAHDHSFHNVEFLADQPEYTFHKFIGVENFRDYVEQLAIEWTNHIINEK